MDINELIELIRRGESDTIEFKEKATAELAAEMVSFANTRGGYILVGVSDDGKIVGVDPQVVRKILEASIQNIHPPIDYKVEELSIGGKVVVVIRVNSSPYVVEIGGKVYVRIGTTKRPLDISELIMFGAEKLYLKFDETITPVSAVNVDDSVLSLLADRLKRSEVRSWLEANGYVKYGKFTVAGLLVFGKRPAEYFHHARIRIKVGERDKIVSGPLPRQVDETVREIIDHLGALELRAGIRRIGIDPVPVIREVVTNAVVHRNYAIYSEVFVYLSSTEIRIVNPGGFPPGVSPDEPRPSPRNPKIYEAMFRLGYIEREGSGILFVKRLCRDLGWKVEWKLKEYVTEVCINWLPSVELDEVDRKILSGLDFYFRASKLAKYVGLSKVAVLNRLKRLERIGLVKHVGKGPGTKWVKVNR